MTTTTTTTIYCDTIIINLIKGERMIATTQIAGVTYKGEVTSPTGKNSVEEWIAYSLLKGIYQLNVREYKNAIAELTAALA